MTTKICNKCKIEKSVDEFCKNRNTCKQCKWAMFKQYRELHKERYAVSAKQRYLRNRDKRLAYGQKYSIENQPAIKKRRKRYYKENIDKISAYAKKRYLDNPEKTIKHRFSNWRHCANRRNITFDITLQDLESIPLVCHYTCAKLTLLPNQPNTVSLDRLDSNKGYTKDNVVFCCAYINFMKQDLDYSVFIGTCKLIGQVHDWKETTKNALN